MRSVQCTGHRCRISLKSSCGGPSFQTSRSVRSTLARSPSIDAMRTSGWGRRSYSGWTANQSAGAALAGRALRAPDDQQRDVVALRPGLEALQWRSDPPERLLGGRALAAQGVEQAAVAETLVSALGVEDAVGVKNQRVALVEQDRLLGEARVRVDAQQQRWRADRARHAGVDSYRRGMAGAGDRRR